MMFHPVQMLLFLSDLWKQVQLQVLLQMTMSQVVKDEKSCEKCKIILVNLVVGDVGIEG